MLLCVAVCRSALKCMLYCVQPCAAVYCSAKFYGKGRARVRRESVAVCCSVLQGVAVCCSVLQRAAVCCSVLPRAAIYAAVCAAVCCSVCCSVLQCMLQCVLQCVAVSFSTKKAKRH